MSLDFSEAELVVQNDVRPTASRVADEALLQTFRRAARSVPAYQTVLTEHGVIADRVEDAASYTMHAPVLSKANTFDRFSIGELSVDGVLPPLADVLTSSGHGGRFSFGVTTREQARRTTSLLDDAFDAAFGIKSRSTLAINCLPMGVVFSSDRMTVATTSVREDMAVALVRTFGARFEQLMLVADPLFLKRLLDYGRETALEWHRHRVNVVLGEETFGEEYRRYVAARLGLTLDAPESGYIMSSFGVGELGLHLCYETPATISLRRALMANRQFARELFGDAVMASTPLPMLFTFNPERTFIETLDVETDGFGRMTTTMLDATLPVPLLRYQTGDIVRLLDRAEVLDCAQRHGIELPAALPGALIAVRGREREVLPTGSHAAIYKDALYADWSVADRLSGAVRLVCDAGGCTMHVQLAEGAHDDISIRDRLFDVLPPASHPARIVVWPHLQFPFGMQLDYERKFKYVVPGETPRV